jgi:hypothetical protein
VDLFVPWLRSPFNAIENLVVADRRANNNRRGHLAAADHVQRWRERNERLRDDLGRVAEAQRWETAPASSLGVARALRLALSPANLLWAAPGLSVPTDVVLVKAALAG